MFLHGYLADKRSFSYQIPFFEKYFEVFAPDLKGFGENIGMEYPYSLSDYVEDVREYMDKNGIKKPSVIAHSFGGRVAIKSSRLYPDIFDKIVLTGSAGLKPKPTLKKTFKKICYKAVKPFLKGKKPTLFFSKDYNLLSPVMKQSFCKIVSEHLDDSLKFIHNPTMIVFGKGDKETPVYMAYKLHKEIVDSKLLIIEDAGHFCFIDKPVIFNTEVKEFLLS